MKDPKIRISNGCLFFLCAYGVLDPYRSFWIFLLSVCAHEGGHILALFLMKKKIWGLDASFGSVILHTEPLSYREELIVAAAGPLINGILFLIPVENLGLWHLINAILLCYNLLPLYPLDGGRMVRSGLSLLLPVSFVIRIEKWIVACTFLGLFSSAVYFTFGLHSGLWPILFCGFLICRVEGLLFPH